MGAEGRRAVSQDRELPRHATVPDVRGQRVRPLAVRLQHRRPDLRPPGPGKRAVSLLHGRQDPRCVCDDRPEDGAPGGAGSQDRALAAFRRGPFDLRHRAQPVQERAGQQADLRGGQPRARPRVRVHLDDREPLRVHPGVAADQHRRGRGPRRAAGRAAEPAPLRSRPRRSGRAQHAGGRLQAGRGRRWRLRRDLHPQLDPDRPHRAQRSVASHGRLEHRSRAGSGAALRKPGPGILCRFRDPRRGVPQRPARCFLRSVGRDPAVAGRPPLVHSGRCRTGPVAGGRPAPRAPARRPRCRHRRRCRGRHGPPEAPGGDRRRVSEVGG